MVRCSNVVDDPRPSDGAIHMPALFFDQVNID